MIFLAEDLHRGVQTFTMNFGEWLAQERERRGWNTTQMASATGVSQPLISMYEKGERKPKQATVLQIAAGLGMDPNPALIAAGFAPTKEITSHVDPDLTAIIEYYEGAPPDERKRLKGIVDVLARTPSAVYDPSVDEREREEDEEENNR